MRYTLITGRIDDRQHLILHLTHGLPRPAPSRYNARMFVSSYKRLTPAQKAFVDAYVTQAERDAERRNERISCLLQRPIVPDADGMLENVIVQTAIAERINERAQTENLTWQRVTKELMAMAFSSVADFGNVLPDGTIEWKFENATPEAMSAIKSIEVTGDAYSPSRKFKVVMHDKLAATKQLTDLMMAIMQSQPHLMAAPRDIMDTVALPTGTSVEGAQEAFAKIAGE